METKFKNVKEIILVLGMHRSATSLTSMLLSEMGLYLGKKEDMLDAADCNERGFFELQNVVDLDDQILLDNHLIWSSILPEKMDFTTSHVDDMYEILMKLIQESGDKSVAMKDPRCCVLEPIWKSAIQKADLKERCIVVFRHPYEVASSIEKRDKINFCYSLKLWFYYNYSILENIAALDAADVLVVEHNEYFITPEKQLKKILEFLRINENEKKYLTVIDGKLRHNNWDTISKNIPQKLHAMVMEMYKTLLQLSKQEIDISQVDLLKFKKYLKKMVCHAYIDDKTDTALYAYGANDGATIKKWCIAQLEKQPAYIKEQLQKYFAKNNIIKLAIYGNGSLAQALYPLLEETNIEICAVYEQSPKDSIIFHNKKIEVCNLSKSTIQSDCHIINTVLFYEKDVELHISSICETTNVISLYRLLYEIRKEGKDE
jgi:hypothetical protein